ncbi:MAG TPA: sulfotransferase [Rhizomicrobium sp.]|jgi:hypothetical protein
MSDSGANSSNGRYPDFVCIGAQKAGTTWLHQKLARHPDVWLPALKEVHYFDAVHLHDSLGANLDAARRAAAIRSIQSALKGNLTEAQKLLRIRSITSIGVRELSDAWYGAIFQEAPAQAICGEITPEYAMLPPQGVEHMVRLQPGIKIIFIMRDPIDRAWSALRMMKKRTGSEGPLPIRDRPHGRKFLERADYAATLERFQRQISKANFLELYFDDLVERPEALLQQVCAFLGVDFAAGKFKRLDKRIHRGEPAVMEPETYNRLRQELAPAYERLLNLKNPLFEKWYSRHYGEQTAASHIG